MAEATGTQAVDRAAGLLLAVMAADARVSFSELQEGSGLAKSTLSRLLSSLERNDLVARGEDGFFLPGPALTRFALSRRPTDQLIDAIWPFMASLNEATGETINLAVLEGPDVQQIGQIECTYLVGGVNWTDQPIPLHASALGKVFLAHGTELPPGRLTKFAPRTITSRSDLLYDLERCRERGWALADSELEAGLIAVAAPVFAADGSVAAALSVSGPTLRMTREVTEEYAMLLLDAAQAASEILGFTGHVGPAPAVPPITRGRVGAA